MAGSAWTPPPLPCRPPRLPRRLVGAAAVLALAAVAAAQNAAPDGGSDSGPQATSESSGEIVVSLWVNGVFCAIEIALFLILRPRFKKVYAPRTFLGPKHKRVPPQPAGLLGWIVPVIKTNKFDILASQGLDAFVYLEYLEMNVVIFLPIFLLTFLILIPVYTTGYTANKSGIDRLTFGNVGREQTAQLRYIATLVIQVVCTVWACFVVLTKVRNVVQIRQDYLTSPRHTHSAQARSILVTGIPNNLLSEKRLTKMYSHLPGGVAKVWINRNLRELPALVALRDKLTERLEEAQTRYTLKAYKLVRHGKLAVQETFTDEGTVLQLAGSDEEIAHHLHRPTFRTGRLSFFHIGKKQDTFEYCRHEIARLNAEIDARRRDMARNRKRYPPKNSAFILFNQQIAAYLAYSAQTHHLPYMMVNRYFEAHPKDIVWANLNVNPYEKKIRTTMFWGATWAMVMFWCIPVGIVGLISNINALTKVVHFLDFMTHIGYLQQMIQGMIPSAMLALVNSTLPIILRIFGRLSGEPTRTSIELSLMDRLFYFNFFQNFLFLTIVSGSVSDITNFVYSLANHPTAFPGDVAGAIPQGATFFIAYIMLAGVQGAAAGLLQVIPFALYYIRKFVFGQSPRGSWRTDNRLFRGEWGILFPNTTLITIIATGYMVIAPMVSLFALTTFCLYWLLYRYQLIYVWLQRPQSETLGLYFPKAIDQFFWGLYLEMVMVTALFFLAGAPNSRGQTKQTAIPQGGIMIVLIVGVACFHYFLNDSYKPLLTTLPLSLVHDDDELLRELHEDEVEAELEGEIVAGPMMDDPEEETGREETLFSTSGVFPQPLVTSPTSELPPPAWSNSWRADMPASTSGDIKTADVKTPTGSIPQWPLRKTSREASTDKAPPSILVPTPTSTPPRLKMVASKQTVGPPSHRGSRDQAIQWVDVDLSGHAGPAVPDTTNSPAEPDLGLTHKPSVSARALAAVLPHSASARSLVREGSTRSLRHQTSVRSLNPSLTHSHSASACHLPLPRQMSQMSFGHQHTQSVPLAVPDEPAEFINSTRTSPNPAAAAAAASTAATAGAPPSSDAAGDISPRTQSVANLTAVAVPAPSTPPAATDDIEIAGATDAPPYPTTPTTVTAAGITRNKSAQRPGGHETRPSPGKKESTLLLSRGQDTEQDTKQDLLAPPLTAIDGPHKRKSSTWSNFFTLPFLMRQPSSQPLLPTTSTAGQKGDEISPAPALGAENADAAGKAEKERLEELGSARKDPRWKRTLGPLGDLNVPPLTPLAKQSLAAPLSFMRVAEGARAHRSERSLFDKEFEVNYDELLTAFLHPAAKEPQLPLWYPQDELGLAHSAVAKAQALGLAVTTDGARIEERTSHYHILKWHGDRHLVDVAVTAAHPPGEPWDSEH